LSVMHIVPFLIVKVMIMVASRLSMDVPPKWNIAAESAKPARHPENGAKAVPPVVMGQEKSMQQCHR
jgi:hypothetical protein